MEQLILYPYDMAVARLFSLAGANPTISRRLTSFYGDESWRAELEQSVKAQERTEERRARFVRLYAGKLRQLGYKFVETFGPLSYKRRPLYHVIFASDHSVGAKIMHDVWAKTRFVPGELWYSPVKRPSPPGIGIFA
jgi:three-Cys-motif partner protein